jgi:glyoxylase-like metal-dependent hydrolase (beta-lactamase superfamily II)
MNPIRCCATGCALLAASGMDTAGAADRAKPAASVQAPATAELSVLPVQGNVYMISGGDAGNVTVQVGKDGVVVVDASVPELSAKIIAAIRTLSDRPIRYLLDTSADADHAGGNYEISHAGIQFGGGYSHDQSFTPIWAHENVLNALSAPTGRQPRLAQAAWPSDTYFTASMELYFNGEAIVMLAQPAAHSDGDSMVYFRGSDVIATGDVFLTTTYPVIELEHGGTINGVIAALNRIIDITIPKENEEDGTLVVPGHGRLCDEYDVVVYRDMVTVLRDRIQDLKSRGMALEQVLAARPTMDYDGRYGGGSGIYSTREFVSAVYKTLPEATQAPK